MKLQKWPQTSHFVHVLHRAETNVIRSHTFKQSIKKKKNNPKKKKSIPKGEERCSNCQVERDERKRNPKLLWLQTNTTSAAEWPDRLRLKPHLEHAAWMWVLQTSQVTPWRHACGQMWIETNVGRFTVTDWLIFHTCISQKQLIPSAFVSSWS